jgi:hypothetical protein
MSQPKILHHAVYFRREGTGSLQGTIPAPTINTSQYYLGVVTSVSIAKEAEEALFRKPVGGKWVDYDAKNQQDSEVWTFNGIECTPLFWELVLAHSGVLAGGTGTVVPGSTITHKGWLQIISTDDSAAEVSNVKFWCKLDIPSVEFPQVGHVPPTFTARKLYSPSNTATLSGVS